MASATSPWVSGSKSVGSEVATSGDLVLPADFGAGFAADLPADFAFGFEGLAAFTAFFAEAMRGLYTRLDPFLGSGV
jgi:hypothetical protein